jgi:hypothetical protein
MRGFIGKSLDAITLNVGGSDADGEFTEALTDNYLKLRLRGNHEANVWMHSAIQSVRDGVLSGELVKNSAEVRFLALSS